MLMCSLVCAVTLECIIENQYHSYSSMKRMEHIFSHVYGFDCVRCPTRISIEHDWRHLFRYGAAQPVQFGSVSNSGAAAIGDSGNGRVMLIDETSVIHRAYYKLLAKLHHGHLAHADGNGDWVLTIFSANSFYCGKANLEKSDLVPNLKILKDRSIWRSQIVVEKIDAKLLNQQQQFIRMYSNNKIMQ
ncbi:hypothetical protein P8452_39812 [Trifolium repens]|nr:hypothetical protein P8452_39812 [Trifolium repens]